MKNGSGGDKGKMGAEEQQAKEKQKHYGESSSSRPNRAPTARDEDDSGHEFMNGIFKKMTAIPTSMSVSLFCVVNTLSRETHQFRQWVKDIGNTLS